MAWLTIKQLSKKYDFNIQRLRNWVKWGVVKAKKKNTVIEHKTNYGGKAKMKKAIWYVDEDSFLDIPAFLRRNYKGRGNFKSLKK